VAVSLTFDLAKSVSGWLKNFRRHLAAIYGMAESWKTDPSPKVRPYHSEFRLTHSGVWTVKKLNRWALGTILKAMDL